MSVQTSWASDAPAVAHTVSYELRTGDRMRVEATGRIETAENCIVSEARLIEPQDGLLVEEAINGSSAAFGVLFERCERKVFHAARNMLRNREDADDAVQQAFERAYVHLKSFQGQSRFST
jgi:sigma-70-like protein